MNLSAKETSHSVLEIAILGGVNEGVDAAAGERQHHGEVVKNAVVRAPDLRSKVTGSILTRRAVDYGFE